jgi:class 3 adenylate cyclase
MDEVQASPSPRGFLQAIWDAAVWRAVRSAVEAVRYQPRHLDLVLACGPTPSEGVSPLVRWWVDAGSALVRANGVPHVFVRTAAARATSWFGPTASAILRWFSGATAAVADQATGRAVEGTLGTRAHPGLLVPHLHEVAVAAVDMRGFSRLTRELRDTQYLTDLIGDYLTELTTIVERHRGVVFQYTGDGLLAVFLPELVGTSASVMINRLVNDMSPELHATFDRLYVQWRAAWQTSGRPDVRIGLGVGLSFGPATIGFIGPAGKKQIGVIGEPVNLAAYLCSQAQPGEVLVDHGSFARAGAEPPAAKTTRLRSRKRHQRIEIVRLRQSARPRPTMARFLPAPGSS